VGTLIVRLIVNAVALLAAEWLVNLFIPGGMQLTNQLPDLLIVIVIFGVVNALVKPVVSALSCPVNFFTLGLFTLVINALMLLLTAYIASAVGNSEWLNFTGSLNGFWPALLAGIVISVVSTILSSIAGDGD
jgi:putative membrane protein